MAWEFVGIWGLDGTTAVGSVTTTITLAEPSGCQAGDLLIACHAYRIASTTSMTLPTGGEWTLVAEQKANNTLTTSSAVASGMMAYCVRGGSAPNLVFTYPKTPSVGRGFLVVYRPVDSGSPLDTQTSFTTAVNTTSVSGTGLTTTAANDLLVGLFAGGQEAGVTNFDAATNPATSSGSGSGITAAPANDEWQERAETTTISGADTSIAVFDAVKTTAGATGNISCTASVAAAHVVIVGAFKMGAAAETRRQPPVRTSYSAQRASVY